MYWKKFTQYHAEPCVVPARLHFEDDGKNQGPLGGLLADVAFQVHADFFLDDAPVGFFFGVGFFDGLQDDQPRAGNKFLAVVAHQAARHDFRMRFHLARVFVDRDDRHDDPVFGKMFSIANHDVFDFFERTGIHDTRPAVTGSRRYAPSSVNSICWPSSTSRISPDTTPNWCARAAWRKRCRNSPCTGMKYFGLTSCSRSFCSSWLACPETWMIPAELS